MYFINSMFHVYRKGINFYYFINNLVTEEALDRGEHQDTTTSKYRELMME